MRNRDYKNFAKGEFFHVYNRGVGKMDIFKDEADMSVFMNRLYENLFPEKQKRETEIGKKKKYERKLLPPNSFDLISYCLMPNHFHLLIKQLTDLPISQLMLKVCTGYSMYFNKKYDRVGSLFQDVFKTVAIETNEQLLWVSLYIHENPIKSGLVKKLEEYRWSSFLDYIGINKGICNKDVILGQYKDPTSYLQYFRDPQLHEDTQNLMIGSEDIFIDEDY